ncbi:hypothetical protein M431DRAFT_504190 [Trichoderma harzianum CBS 226.95]|uniref:Uncharacterized protein n=1 Tax=Trichoderma harzianum CBS 226.95 TaxID=983964 RepID=A0A2T4AQC6_TRIHA|nr:hypothetical protein M431DRAFT_504190 [Trichoderma harzianum CBS 226.95]PTB59261.1 hypothetical protein M431DRAFT_504190 [Trichoderma harzianum CBS 226.95]
MSQQIPSPTSTINLRSLSSPSVKPGRWHQPHAHPNPLLAFPSQPTAILAQTPSTNPYQQPS